MKKEKDPILKSQTAPSLVQCFEETGTLYDRPRSGAPRLSEARTFAVAS